MRMKKICLVVSGLISGVTASCTVPGKHAPVFEHSYFTSIANIDPAITRSQESRLYVVGQGDTLYHIALKFDQDYHDIMSWNNLSKADNIEVGQVLRIPSSHLKENGPSHVEISNVSIEPSSIKIRPLASDLPTKDTFPDKASPSLSGGDWMWPAKVYNQHITFTPGEKGINIFGVAGQIVNAAAGGRIMYAGSGIRGYGNLTIIKHKDNFLSAYAHNKFIFVKEGDIVSKGQRIAEMGKSDSDSVKLHFEIRKQGKPVNPLNFLPKMK